MRLWKHFQAALPGCPSTLGWPGPGAARSQLLRDVSIWAGDGDRTGAVCAARLLIATPAVGFPEALSWKSEKFPILFTCPVPVAVVCLAYVWKANSQRTR